MKQLLKPVLALGLVTASATALTAPVAAQQAQRVGVINIPAVVANSQAFQAAQQQRQTTYAAQVQQAETRRQQIAQQLQPLLTQFNTAREAASPNQQALQQQATQIQQIEAAGQRELQQILGPVALSQAYVNEQIEDRLDQAVQAAAQQAGVTLVLSASSGDILYADASHNLNQQVLAQLNTLLPSVQVQPPAGWQPREIREAAAAQAAAQQGQTAPAVPAQQPTGR